MERLRTDSRTINPDITEYFRGPTHYSPIAFTRNRLVIVWNDLESTRLVRDRLIRENLFGQFSFRTGDVPTAKSKYGFENMINVYV